MRSSLRWEQNEKEKKKNRFRTLRHDLVVPCCVPGSWY